MRPCSYTVRCVLFLPTWCVRLKELNAHLGEPSVLLGEPLVLGLRRVEPLGHFADAAQQVVERVVALAPRRPPALLLVQRLQLSQPPLRCSRSAGKKKGAAKYEVNEPAS